ncbi:MAG TPA: hypothetical protein VJ600_07655 [Holophagaceae bacterium]|nr:hypothetical protein [Holophagaceae bacterium]
MDHAARPVPFHRRPEALAFLLLLALAAHAWVKWRLGTLPELLWGCNVATFFLVAGLWTCSAALVGMAFLWHICVGDLAYLAGAVQQGHWGWSSVLVHSLPALAGLVDLRRTGLPRSSPYLAFLMFVALVPLSHYLTPVSLNINLTHQRLMFLQRAFPGNWDYRIAFSVGLLGLLLAGDALAARWFGRPEGGGPIPGRRAAANP